LSLFDVVFMIGTGRG